MDEFSLEHLNFAVMSELAPKAIFHFFLAVIIFSSPEETSRCELSDSRSADRKHGGGISEEDFEKKFEKQERLSSSRST